jgi:hypothetical protein
MSTIPDDETAALRGAELDRLSKLPYFPSERPDENGVLLSDRIKHYCREHQLIAPFDEKLLQPAGYDLTVGRNYSKLGKRAARHGVGDRPVPGCRHRDL